MPSRFNPGCKCCDGGGGGGCAIEVCFRVLDGSQAGNPAMPGVPVTLYDPDDVEVDTVATDADGWACFSLPEGPAGEYVVDVPDITCYEGTGGPVDLECDTTPNFTLYMTFKPDECLGPVTACGCTSAYILKTIWTMLADDPDIPGDPLAGVAIPATIPVDGSGNPTEGLYRSAVIPITWTFAGSTLRSARVLVDCDFTNSSTPGTTIYVVNYYTSTDASGIHSYQRSGAYPSPTGGSFALGCRTGPFSIVVYRQDSFGSVPPYTPVGTVYWPE